MTDEVEVRFTITLEGMVGGSFDMDRAICERIKEKWEEGVRRHDATDLADELLFHAPFDIMRFLNIESMEIEELDVTEDHNV